ncbi:MAG: iron-sulfur cluster repair di-iron protein [Geobacteraceae bacterium GWC2_58_44]|nr:MAG: iron-sulfur cluster repair di-iron protein [Geobacteraceae bacterium GWC2_58_44]HBG06817.1 iron-sulfur cluster repair di-iron protein [Geobacter sp.]
MKESGQVSAENMDAMTIGAVVAGDYRAAGVFEKYGIDFCCGGNVAVATACREKGIDLEELHREIEKAVDQPMDRSQNYCTWELPFLADYIVNTHHAYLKENTEVIASYARKIAQVHGAHHPEVIKIAAIFDRIATDMKLHLRDEEELLFPVIRKLAALEKAGAAHEDSDIEVLRAKLDSLSHEHDDIGAAIHDIRRLAEDYLIPEGVCNTFMVTYQKLKEFEDDLHKHVHLENNILFLKAAKL